MRKKYISKKLSARADEIFIRALEIESKDEQTAFVEGICAGDKALRLEVARLFALQEQLQPRFMEDSPMPMTAADILDTMTDFPALFENGITPVPDDDEVGKQIGNYKLLQKIGEGGVGNVYLAEQSKPVRRQVALKIIKIGMDTKSVIARFAAERQALAMMNHPNIAHVFNAGETETGRPFFVMELVPGKRITTYCDENSLAISHRLRLFVQVCHAIQHAHQKGIIHRDIKPSNILITLHDGEPSPIVIDFGIAKATGSELLTDKTINTSFGPVIGTPAYMSPEQTNLAQPDIDTRSDIYSLGALLYELLISQPPFVHKELLKSGLDELCRILREKNPQRPSVKFREMDPGARMALATNRKTDPQRLSTLLADDLDWITMKAMEKERERRYESASEMASDIHRFLNHEPVTAGPPSRVYVFKKLVRRNKATFAYLAVISLVVLAGLGTSTWLFILEREAKISEQQARQHEQRLLHEADARARIAQAALLLNRDALAEADQMMEIIEIPVVQPSLEAAGVFRTLAEWNVKQGRWNTAAERYLQLQQANRLDKSNTTKEMTRDLLGAGPALVIAGKKDEYRRFIQKTIERFINTPDPTAAEQVIKNSLILPLDENTLIKLKPFVQGVERAIVKDEDEAAENSYLIGWRTLAMALYSYRCGNYEEALKWGQRSLSYSDQNAPRVSMDHIVLAMTYTRLHEPKKARMELNAGQALVNENLPGGVEHIMELGSQETGVWHDWAIAYLLLQEANSLIAKVSTENE